MSITKDQLKLYAITDSGMLKNGITLNEAVENAITGGAAIVQLREKNLPEDEIVKRAIELKEVCHRHSVPLIINDSAETACKAGADGVHLGLDDGDIAAARKLLGERAIIGATAHNLDEAMAAQEKGADYIGCGALFPTSTKNNTVPLSIEELERICRTVDIPVVAIGGITPENITKLKNTGIAGAAVVSALFAQEDIRQAAERLKNIIEGIL